MQFKARNFIRDASGGVTIEFVLWMPLIAFLLVFAFDASLAYMRQSQIWQASREAARYVSRYEFTNAEAEAFVAEASEFGGERPTVNVSQLASNVVVEAQMPVSALTPFGSLGFVRGQFITTRVSHAMEPF